MSCSELAYLYRLTILKMGRLSNFLSALLSTIRAHPCNPWSVFPDELADLLGIRLLQPPCKRPRLAVADVLAVYRDNRQHFGRRARQEQFADAREIPLCQGLLAQRQPGAIR